MKKSRFVELAEVWLKTDTRYPEIWDYSRFQDKSLAEEALRDAEKILKFVATKLEKSGRN